MTQRLFLRICYLCCCAVFCTDIAWARDSTPPVGMVQVPAGIYENQNYGFSLVVPATVAAYRDAPTNPNHGILIKLGKRRRLFASAMFDVLYLGSAKVQMDNLVQAGGNLLKREQVQWAGFPAEQALLQKGPVMRLIRTQYRADGKILYELRLESTRTAFARDRRLFEKIAASFKQLARD